MKKNIQKAYKILRNNLLYFQPLLIYMMIISFALPIIISAKVFVHPKIVLTISMLLLTVANIAGWFHINKLAVKSYNEDDEPDVVAEKNITNFKTYFAGVGENFGKVLFGGIIFAVFYSIAVFGLLKLCMLSFGEPVIAFQFKEMAELKTVQDFTNFFAAFSQKDVLIFKLWLLVIFFAGVLFNFFGFLYFTVLIFEKDDPFISLLNMLKFFFKNIFGSISVIAYMLLLYFILNILSLFVGATSFGFAILMILLAVYFNYYLLLVFCFYDEKTKNNSNSRTEFIG